MEDNILKDPIPKNKHKKNTILMVAVIFLVILPGAYLILNRQQINSQLIPDQKIITIEYTGDDFSPSYLRITKNTKVIWVNKDSSTNTSLEISSGSDTSKSLKDFGNKEGVGLNGTYSYVFEEEGLYSYRNQVSPTINGSIEVVKD